MKGTVIVLGTTLIAAVIASTESPSPDSPTKVEANSNGDLRQPAASPAQDNKPPEPSSATVELMNIAPPTVTPIGTAIPARSPEK
jgi:hypothetical protein